MVERYRYSQSLGAGSGRLAGGVVAEAAVHWGGEYEEEKRGGMFSAQEVHFQVKKSIYSRLDLSSPLPFFHFVRR